MTHRLVITTAAKRDLEGLFAYLCERNPVAALNTVTRIVEAASLLSEHPFMGRTGKVAGTRELVVTLSRYIIAYRVKETTIEIARVMHHSQAGPRRM